MVQWLSLSFFLGVVLYISSLESLRSFLVSFILIASVSAEALVCEVGLHVGHFPILCDTFKAVQIEAIDKIKEGKEIQRKSYLIFSQNIAASPRYECVTAMLKKVRKVTKLLDLLHGCCVDVITVPRLPPFSASGLDR